MKIQVDQHWRPACYVGNYGEPCPGRFILIGGKTIRCECEECPFMIEVKE